MSVAAEITLIRAVKVKQNKELKDVKMRGAAELGDNFNWVCHYEHTYK